MSKPSNQAPRRSAAPHNRNQLTGIALAVLALAVTHGTAAQAQEAAKNNGAVNALDSFVVSGKKLSEAEKDRAKLQAVTGATAVVDQQDIQRGRSATLEDLSGTIDPPVTWYYGSTGSGYIRPMTSQEATTFEIGLRKATDTYDASLTLYHSRVTNELLSVVVVPATTTTAALVANYNASATVHQGIEAGLHNVLRKADGNELGLRQALTVNDFRYFNDPVYGTNILPGLPRYTYQAELQYQDAGGYYVSGNVLAASSYYVDYANTLEAPAYAILGGKVGYQAPGKRWSVFLDARNILDKHYVSASTTAYNLGGVDSGAIFRPGDGAGIVVGATLRF